MLLLLMMMMVVVAVVVMMVMTTANDVTAIEFYHCDVTRSLLVHGHWAIGHTHWTNDNLDLFKLNL